MIVNELAVRAFRCFESAHIEAGAGINVILGDNGSGKSSVLEALHILGRGQSFRHSQYRDRILDGSERFNLTAHLSDDYNLRHRLTAEGFPSRTEFSYDDDRNISRLELVQTLPLQLIDPNLHRLLEHGPDYRRRFMDWGVFHVEHAFFPAWRRYRRALRQRNSALRNSRAKPDIVSWDRELVHQAEIVDASRRAYVDALDACLPEQTRRIIGDAPIHMDYQAGWPRDEGLGSALARTLEQDRRAGYTHNGPHRADLRIDVDKRRVRDRASRGQQKLLTAVLLLAQARIIKERRGLHPLVLVDDLAAELGHGYRESIGRELQALGGQSFVTFLDQAFVPDAMSGGRMFQLDDGVIRVL